MQFNRTTIVSIGSPLLVACVYLVALYKPWLHTAFAPGRITAEESGKLWEQCNALYRAGKYQQALPAVLKLHESYPGNHIYIEMASDIYDHLGRYEEEAAFWEQYFDRAPNPVTACPQIGQAYWKQGKQQEAISAFERCLALDPENSDSIFFFAHALELSGETERAGELYQRGLKIAPRYSDLQLGLARVRLRQGREAEARQMALNVLRKDTQNVDALLVAGLAYSREDNFARARQYLEDGVKLSDGYLDFHFALARLDEQQRNYSGAIREYDRILQDRPADAEVRAMRDALLEKH
jgi:tetratricopeptide (TPR) repeat protein